jgi:TRAP transporter TAXI family solute receptor
VATDNNGEEPRNGGQNSEGGDARKGEEKPAAKAGWQADLRPNLSQPDRFARSSGMFERAHRSRKTKYPYFAGQHGCFAIEWQLARSSPQTVTELALKIIRRPNQPAAHANLLGAKRGMRVGFWIAVGVIITLGWTSPASSAPPNWPASLTIGTASPGGVYYVYGQGLAPLLNEALGIAVSAQATQGPEQNILLLESGDAPVGFVTMGVALQGWNGTGEWTKGRQLRAMRALFPMFDTPFQFVMAQHSGIRSLADMAGKRIGVGPQGGTGGTYLPLVFKALDIPVTLRYGAWDTLAAQLQSHLLDGIVGTIGVPAPFIAKLDAAEPLQFIAPNDGEIAALRKAMPELGVTVVPPGAYPSLKTEYKTVGLFNFAVASKDLPDDLVYHIVKAFYANHDRMVEVHPTARESVVENLTRNEFLPYHPGALRYYREVGVALAASPARER